MWDGVSCSHRVPLASLAPTSRTLPTTRIQFNTSWIIQSETRASELCFACKDLHDQSLQAQAGVPSVLIVRRMLESFTSKVL